MILTTQDVSVS